MIIYTKKDSDADFLRYEESRSELLQTINLENENLICVAGRPGMGKTSLALHLAHEYARNSSKAVYIFTMELLANHVYDRLLISLSKVDSYTFREKLFSASETERIELAKKQLSQMNLIIDDETNFLTVSQIKERIEKFKNIGLIIIDYFQLLFPEERMIDQIQERYEMCRQLKRLSKQLNIPIILTSQLPRSVESRVEKRPRLTDLNGTGILEHDVDVVCFLYREGYYEPFEHADKAEIIIPKNKQGIFGTILLKWEGQFMKFSSDT